MQHDTTHRCAIGPLRIWLRRRHQEWWVATQAGSDPVDDTLEPVSPCAPETIPTDASVSRFGTSDVSEDIEFWPLMADRAIVSRPDEHFQILPGEQITLYIGSPLWVRLSIHPSATPLLEVPLFRPSDTWFGPDTVTGELCYATRTQCRMNLSEVPVRPHRAITTAQISNRATSPLLIERLKLPVTHLALYVSDDGRLLTQDIVLRRREGSSFADMQVIPGPPASASSATRLTAPRANAGSSLLVRAFSSLF